MAGNSCISVDSDEIRAWVQDLRALLNTGSIMEQKTFLGPFIKKVTVKQRKVTIDYTIPIHGANTGSPTREVLPLIQNGYSNPIKCLKARFCEIVWGL